MKIAHRLNKEFVENENPWFYRGCIYNETTQPIKVCPWHARLFFFEGNS
jgi:hypothetical protein